LVLFPKTRIRTQGVAKRQMLPVET